MILQDEHIPCRMIGESSRKVIDAMSDIVWPINPDNDSFEKIILRMRSLAYNILRAKKIEFSFHADEVAQRSETFYACPQKLLFHF